MKPLARTTLAILGGLIIGSLVNMGIILLGPALIPPPEGADTTTMEGLKATMHLFEPKHFLAPFMAHALGTLVGAFVAAKIVQERKTRAAMVIGGAFFLGGLTNIFMLPSPIWFSALDLIFAYIPMAWLATKLARASYHDPFN